jgi:hypothetical protein
LWRLRKPTINTLTLSFNWCIDSRETQKEAIEAICVGYPGLESLFLEIDDSDQPNDLLLLLQMGYWPRLKNLSLEWYGEFADGPLLGNEMGRIVSNFFKRHPKLHTLTVTVGSVTTDMIEFLSENNFDYLQRLSLIKNGGFRGGRTYPERGVLSRMFGSLFPTNLKFLSCGVTEKCIPYFIQMISLRFLCVSIEETLLKPFLVALKYTPVERLEIILEAWHHQNEENVDLDLVCVHIYDSGLLSGSMHLLFI